MTDKPTLAHARALAAKFRRQQATADATRAELVAVILALTAQGERQVDIAEATGYTRERIRQLTTGKR